MRHRRTISATVLTMVLAASAAAAGAAEIRGLTLADGTRVAYGLVLPEGYTAEQTWPAVLAFPPGSQTLSMVETGLRNWWESEGARRGFVVVSPAAPNGELFFLGSRAHIAPFLDAVIAEHNLDPAQIHVGGISNGGISAFAAALDHPDRFLSLTALPGFPPQGTEPADLERLAGLRVTMFAGEEDPVWAREMASLAAYLTSIGQEPYLEVVPGAGHTIGELTGPGAARIYDRLP